MRRSPEGLGCFLWRVERRKGVCKGGTHSTTCPINLRSAFWALDGFRPVRQVRWTRQVERNSVPTLHSELWTPLLWVPDLVDVNCSCSPFTRDSLRFMGCPPVSWGVPPFHRCPLFQGCPPFHGMSPISGVSPVSWGVPRFRGIPHFMGCPSVSWVSPVSWGVPHFRGVPRFVGCPSVSGCPPISWGVLFYNRGSHSSLTLLKGRGGARRRCTKYNLTSPQTPEAASSVTWRQNKTRWSPGHGYRLAAWGPNLQERWCHGAGRK